MKSLKPILPDDKGFAGRLIIAGPCSAETLEQTLGTAVTLGAGGVRIFRAGLWKPRTKPGSFEGVGAKGLEWLAEVKRVTGMLTATEVANASHVEEAVGAGVDILWLGARTTASPFTVQEIADKLHDLGASDIAVLVKNPVNPDPDLWVGALQRIYNAGIRRLAAVHRGFSTYGDTTFRNTPMWQIPIELKRRFPSLPLICDPSHIGGRRDLIRSLSQHALDMGFDGLMIESHCDPDNALSDPDQQLPPESLLAILGELNYRTAALSPDDLSRLRGIIDSIDDELIKLLARRMEVSREIGQYKQNRSIPVVQPGRYDSILASRVQAGIDSGISEQCMNAILAAIHSESVRQQIEIGKGK